MRIKSLKQSVLFILTAGLFICGCGDKTPAEGNTQTESGINFYTEVLEFPDPDASRRSPESGRSAEKEQFAERAGRAYNDIIAEYGGNPPLEGPGKIQFAKRMMLAQAEILFDMKLGAGHPSRKKFLGAVGWCFDQRQPINSSRQLLLNKGVKYHKQANDEYNAALAKLKSAAVKKFKEILGKKDYSRLTGE